MYNRSLAVEYAQKWALSRNPNYYNFDALGGDCTNFISQCLYAGSGVMNYTPDTGWYYFSLNNRSAAWTGVDFLYRFLTTNTGPGPYGTLLPLQYAIPGDVIQLSFNNNTFSHSLLVTYTDTYQNTDSILVAAHTNDALNRPITSYNYQVARLIHIQNVNPGE